MSSHIDDQLSTFKGGILQLAKCLLGIMMRLHLDKASASRFAVFVIEKLGSFWVEVARFQIVHQVMLVRTEVEIGEIENILLTIRNEFFWL